MKYSDYLVAWWRLSRVPFLSVGILPLILGSSCLARGYSGPSGLYLLSSTAVILIMWMTYYLGEWNDFDGDRLNLTHNRFSGGRGFWSGDSSPQGFSLSGVFLSGWSDSHRSLYLYPIPDRSLDPIPGRGRHLFRIFYSNRPFRWSHHGVGEIFIGFCYGWLPIATGFYLFAGFLNPQVFLISIPVSLTIFNVILMNEFPDEESDRAIGKKNLVVRLGKRGRETSIWGFPFWQPLPSSRLFSFQVYPLLAFNPGGDSPTSHLVEPDSFHERGLREGFQAGTPLP